MAFLPIFGFFSEILPIIFYFCFAKRNKSEGLWVVFWYCIVSLLSDPISLLLQHKIDKFYLYSSFTILEYTLFAFFFYSSLTEKILKYSTIVGSLIFYLIVIISFTKKNSGNFDSLSASVEAILIIIYSILFLYQQIKDPAVTYIYYNKKFWIVIALFIYFSSTLFLFLYAATLTAQEHHNYWSINNLFEIIKNIFFCIAFAMQKDKKNPYSTENLYPDIY